MMKKIFVGILFVTFFMISNISVAQVIVDFSPQVNVACANANILFTNTTIGCSGAVSYFWQSGAGAVSTLENPTFSYSSGGTYTVTLTVTCDGQPYSVQKSIVIYSLPNANFVTTHVEGCAPFSVSFNNLSIAGDAPITSYHWDFHDGHTSNEQNPTNTFNVYGIYTILLDITDANGCTSYFSESNMITVSALPTVNFSATNNESCYAPLNVSFIQNVSIYNNLGYSVFWNFGDGSTSTQFNPSHTYTGFGHYNVTLTVTDAAGCINTITKNDIVIIDDIPAAYTILTGNDTVCKNSNVLIQNSTSFNCEWHYDGQTSYSDILSVSYPDAGHHYITLITDPNGPCRDQVTFSIFVEQVDVSFQMVPDQTIYCNFAEIQLVNTSSSNVVNFVYNLPGHEPNQISGIASPEIFFQAGIYTATLMGTTAYGCSGTFSEHSFTVYNNTIKFSINAITHCVPETVTYGYSDFTFPYSNIVSSSWVSSLGGILGTNVSSVSEYYEEPGDYVITLTVTDIYGCVYVYEDTIEEGTPYYPEVLDIFPPAGSPMCACNSWIVELSVNHDTCGYDCNEYFLFTKPCLAHMFDTLHFDGTIIPPCGYSNGMFDFIRSFQYSHNGCVTTNIIDTVYASPPVIFDILLNIMDSTSCGDNLMNYTFTAIAIAADTYVWLIKDSNNNIIYYDNTPNPTINYTFPNNGLFSVDCTVYSDTTSCDCFYFIFLNVGKPTAYIDNSVDTICAGGTVYFNPDNLTGNITQVFWDFGDGTTALIPAELINSDLQHTFTTAGNYSVTLIIWDQNGCTDTTTVLIVVPLIEIEIISENNNGCINLLTTFYNATLSNDPIQNINWVFDDGSSAFGDTVQNFYPDAGTFSLSVFVITKHNCIKNRTFGNYVHVSDVDSNFTIAPQIVCAGQPVVFSAVEQSSNVTYFWDYGDGMQEEANNYNSSYSYQNGGYYDVSLTVTNSLGCSRSKIIPAAVRVEKINSSFYLTQSSMSCYPVGIEVNPSVYVEPDTITVSYFWNFGTTENSDLYNPAYTYNYPGSYNILFVSTTSNGCADSTIQNIVVVGPIADFYVSDTLICLGDNVYFEIINMQNVSEFLWVLGDGASSAQNSFSYTYNYYPPSGFVSVALKLYSIDNSDTCQILLQRKIYIDKVDAEFTILDGQNNIISEICSPFNSILKSNSQNEFTRNWFCDEQLIGNNPNQPHLFVNSAQNTLNFVITLFSYSQIGCMDSVSKNITVFPVPNLTVSEDTTICPDDTISIFASGALNYSWSPDYNISDINIYNPIVYPLENTNYVVYGTNQYNCRDTNSVMVLVQKNVLTDIGSAEIIINIGECFDFRLTSSQNNVSYYWTPDYNISCLDCPNPSICPLSDTTYFLTVSDSLQCFTNNYLINISVRNIFTIDVPTAFTPLSGDANNVVYVRGFGIKKLRYFKIFNRWGQEVFHTDDINIGWDGTFKGVMQNIDNYAFMVEAEMYNGATEFKKGFIMLIK